MALMRATCSECGDVELRARDVQVRTCGNTGVSTYLFRCPVCRMTEVKFADDQVVDILVSGGVRVVEWHLPHELGERPGGEPITADDILDFHELLEKADWFFMLSNLIQEPVLGYNPDVAPRAFEPPAAQNAVDHGHLPLSDAQVMSIIAAALHADLDSDRGVHLIDYPLMAALQ